MNEKLKSLFEDLGKPTLRGVRKCPKCGTYNGTRGVSCKNKACGVVFKAMPERKKMACIDAVKIITGSTAQVFSVRVRDRGPDYRGFVQLPMLSNLGTENGEDAMDAKQTTAQCFMETCQKSVGTGKRSPFEAHIASNSCAHVKAATQCYTEAQPLTLKNSVLNALQISNEIKQDIWLLATETTGPLVQRVSKNVMVVKCKPNPKNPLGFLHLGFFESLKNRDGTQHKFHCSCRAFKNPKAPTKEESQKRCVHFYACICAFASNEKLAEDFSYYIHVDLLEVGNSKSHLFKLLTSNNQSQCESQTLEDTGNILQQQAKKRKADENAGQASSALTNVSEVSCVTVKKAGFKKPPGPHPKKFGNFPIDESHVTMSFHQWLSSVTERINETMHYQFDGNPEPLVFHAPQPFFECLQQRISSGSKKKRLPNSTTGFVRKDALPLGTFSKYTWHLTNILHVKQIFDTPEMPLEILRNFVENRDGTFDLYEPPKSPSENNTELFRKTDHQPLIKPFELKTFLKVGNMTSDQKEPTPFIIEWIPDILPKMKIGELRIKFEYGHQRNGILEHRAANAAQIIHIQSL